MNTIKIQLVRSNAGYSILKRVPMNYLPGCSLFFWQQITPYYTRKGMLLKYCAKKGIAYDLDTTINS